MWRWNLKCLRCFGYKLHSSLLLLLYWTTYKKDYYCFLHLRDATHYAGKITCCRGLFTIPLAYAIVIQHTRKKTPFIIHWMLKRWCPHDARKVLLLSYSNFIFFHLCSIKSLHSFSAYLMLQETHPTWCKLTFISPLSYWLRTYSSSTKGLHWPRYDKHSLPLYAIAHSTPWRAIVITQRFIFRTFILLGILFHAVPSSFQGKIPLYHISAPCLFTPSTYGHSQTVCSITCRINGSPTH
jgi:hypothetical protein